MTVWQEQIEEHAQTLQPCLVNIEVAQLRWMLFALDGTFNAALMESGIDMQQQLVATTHDCRVEVIDIPDSSLRVINKELIRSTGGMVLGLSLFRKLYEWFGAMMTALQEQTLINEGRSHLLHDRPRTFG